MIGRERRTPVLHRNLRLLGLIFVVVVVGCATPRSARRISDIRNGEESCDYASTTEGLNEPSTFASFSPGGTTSSGLMPSPYPGPWPKPGPHPPRPDPYPPIPEAEELQRIMDSTKAIREFEEMRAKTQMIQQINRGPGGSSSFGRP